MSEISEQGSILMPTLTEDRLINKAAKADSDAQPLTQKQLNSMVPNAKLAGKASSDQNETTRHSRKA